MSGIVSEILRQKPKISSAEYGDFYNTLRRGTIAAMASIALISAEPELTKAHEPPDIPADAARHNPGPGVWITNEGSGYYIGRAFKDDMMQKNLYSDSGDYVYGIIERGWNKVKQCGWIESRHVSLKARVVEDSECSPHIERLKKRWTFGKKFNCTPRACVDGKETELSADKACDNKFYYNYAPGKKSARHMSYPTTESGFFDYAGRQYGEVRYRYTTKNSQAVVVRSYKYGWGYMDASCIDGHPRGGPKKHVNTIPGKNPNAKRNQPR